MVTTNRTTWVSIPASACAVCTQCPRGAHAVQELPPSIAKYTLKGEVYCQVPTVPPNAVCTCSVHFGQC